MRSRLLLKAELFHLQRGGQRLSANGNSGRAVSYCYDALARLTSETIANDQ